LDHKKWLSKSAENLAVAQLCFDNDHFNACANRLYYAMFHAGAAALLKNGIIPPKENIGHDWLQANFSGQLIQRRKVFPARFKPYLSGAQALRDIADYKSYSVSKNVAARELNKAKDFVNGVSVEVLK
jgi:uncharacterized protein (UPF0332 family)